MRYDTLKFMAKFQPNLVIYKNRTTTTINSETVGAHLSVVVVVVVAGYLVI